MRYHMRFPNKNVLIRCHRAAERELELRVGSLRGQVKAREESVRELRESYTRIQRGYKARVAGLCGSIRQQDKILKRLQKRRREVRGGREN
jgi:hypothetical protein